MGRAIDPATSTYEGSDYGGARLDLKAKAQDGRTVEVTQAFMTNASPESLGNAIILLKPLDGKSVRLAFEDFRRRTDVTCP